MKDRIVKKHFKELNQVVMDLEKAYDKVNKEALWQVLRTYDVGYKC